MAEHRTIARKLCPVCDDAVPRERPHDCKEKPAPVALTAEMLGEEERKRLVTLQSATLHARLKGDFWLTDECLDDAVDWVTRLLNQGEG